VRIVVWGAGAMGGTIGARLVRADHDVLLVDRDEAHVHAIRERGLRITGPVDDFTVEVPCVTPAELETELTAEGGGGLHVVLLAVKAHHTEAAIGEIEPLLSETGFVVSVQNGLNEEVIARTVGHERTVGCFVNYGADVLEPGVIVRGNRGAVVVGEVDGPRTPRIEWLHRAFTDFEPDAVLTENIMGFLWGKLAYGAILFATALEEQSIADVLDTSAYRPALIAVAREAMQVADALGVRPEPFDGFDPAAFAPEATDEDARASLDRLVEFNRGSAKTHSGVWRDIAVRRRKTEVDAQIAPIAAIGASVGVPTPRIARLVELVHEVETGRRPQGAETLSAL
jgi:2-dehydropantoate 2-reductase